MSSVMKITCGEQELFHIVLDIGTLFVYIAFGLVCKRAHKRNRPRAVRDASRGGIVESDGRPTWHDEGGMSAEEGHLLS